MLRSKGKPQNHTPHISETTWLHGVDQIWHHYSQALWGCEHQNRWGSVTRDLIGWAGNFTWNSVFFLFYFYLFLLTPYRPDGSADFCVWCLKRRGLRKVGPFWVHNSTKPRLGGQNLQKSPNFHPQRAFPSQMKILNNFLTDRDRGKMSIDQNESNCDVISGLPRPLATKTTSGRNFTQRISLITRKRWQMNEKCVQTTISKPQAAYRLVMLFPLCGAT